MGTTTHGNGEESRAQDLRGGQDDPLKPQGHADSGANLGAVGGGGKGLNLRNSGTSSEGAIASLLLLAGGILRQLILEAQDRLARARGAKEKAEECLEWYRKELEESEAEIGQAEQYLTRLIALQSQQESEPETE